MAGDRVIYNGVSMISEWPAFIEAAQSIAHYEIGGRQYPRIRYGDEADDWGANHRPCHDCGVVKGQFHVDQRCDVERCPCCGGQVISCDCEYVRADEGDDSES